MSEFVNRVSAQRKVLEAVNSVQWTEPLLGLTSGALARWCASNAIARDAPIARSLYKVSGMLSSLAAQSHEQISEEYTALSDEVNAFTKEIEGIVRKGKID